MTAGVELFVENGWVYVTDANGPGDFPVRVVHALSESANRRDDGRGWWNGRAYDRDLLNSARDLLDQQDECATDLCEDAAVFQLADASPRCDRHHQEH